MVQKTMLPDQSKEALWRQRLADQAASAMSITQWCRRSDISDSLFHYWRRTLAQRDRRRLPPFRRQGAARNKAQSPRAAFARVLIAPPVCEPPSPSAPASSGTFIEIVLAGSRVVRVSADFDEAALARVLAVLEGRAC